MEESLKYFIALIGIVMVGISGTMLYQNYQEYIDPQVLYGKWIEIHVLSDRKETLVISKHGIFRNDKLVTTHFKYDGSEISFTTGEGEYRYQWNESLTSPQLKRLEPSKPEQTLIKKGYEDTLKVIQSKSIGLGSSLSNP
jgi:hypothetical protein